MRTLLYALATCVALTGCQRSSETAEVKKARDKLTAEDRKLVEAQGSCPEGGVLGSMGVPIKIEVKGQPVFLCCDSCRPDALRDPDKTIAKVDELKAKAKKGAE